ncbi:hypothetical protein ACSTVK_002075 [Escherichia coli]
MTIEFCLAVLTSKSVIALLNFLFLALVIVMGALLGSTLRTGKNSDTSDNKFIGSTHMIGIGAAFICVPFIASFLHLNYQSLLLPLADTTAAEYIEQLFMLISLAGIASYLGYGLLDNIANKVLQSQVQEIGQEQKEAKHSIEALVNENKQIKSNEKKIRLELLYLKAKDAVESGQRYGEKTTEEDKLASKKKYNDALAFLDEGLREINEEDDYHSFDRFMVLKAFTLKRIDDIAGALEIVKKLLVKDKTNPVLLYNMGCYLLLSKQHKDEQEVKDFIMKALTVTPEKEAHKPLQKKIIEKVLARLDSDIQDLFNDDELARIREMVGSKAN